MFVYLVVFFFHPVLWFGQSLSEGSVRVVLEQLHAGAGETAHVMFSPRKGESSLCKKGEFAGWKAWEYLKALSPFVCEKTGQQLGFLKAFSHILLVVSCGLHFSQAGECVKVFANSLAACKRGEQRACLKSCQASLLWL